MTDLRLNAQVAVENYINFLQRINTRNLRLIEKCSEINISFSDDKNYGYGHDAVQNIFLEKLENFKNLKYKIKETIWAEDDLSIYLIGDIVWQNNLEKNESIGVIVNLGVSKEGRITSHHEYKDKIMEIPPEKTFWQRVLGGD